ncbi:MAG: hypothetical protein WB580_08520 [Candidatus Binataceae bacterium]
MLNHIPQSRAAKGAGKFWGFAKTGFFFVVESGTDVRMVQRVAERFELRVYSTGFEGGIKISHPKEKIVLAP